MSRADTSVCILGEHEEMRVSLGMGMTMLKPKGPLTRHVPVTAGNVATRIVVRSAATVLVAAFAYLGICAALWRSGGQGGDAYVVVPQAIDSKHAPAWLKPAEINRINAMGSVVRGRSILDPDLARDLAACYLESPWVSQVLHIRRIHPNRLDVALVIRKPFAVVSRASGPSVVLDRDAVRLPSSALPDGLCVLEGATTNPPAPGDCWNDVRVIDGLRVLERYTRVIEATDGESFAPTKVSVVKWSHPDGRPIVEIVTSRGFPIIWGVDLPNGDATITGSTADEKQRRLAQVLPTLAAQKRDISYLSVRQRAGLVIKYSDEGTGGI